MTQIAYKYLTSVIRGIKGEGNTEVEVLLC